MVKAIEKFGGVRPLARELGHPWHTTVQAWKTAGRIPTSRIPELQELAEGKGIILELDDFFVREVKPNAIQ